MSALPRLFALAPFFLANTLLAHEFWIDSPDYQVEIGENITAYTRNGENFKGIDLAFFEKRAARFEIVDASGQRAVVARPGDSPVYDRPAAQDGLVTLIYQTKPDKLTYAKWEKFQRFIDHKDFGDVQSRHSARALPQDGFVETYSRFTKGLFAVGSGAGKDAPRGLEIEIVALKNPYTDDLSGGLPVQVLYQGAPRANVQVEVFERGANRDVTVSLYRTNAKGIATIGVKSGHAYLLDNVLLREPSPALAAEKNAVWESLWAALTFAVP